MARRRLLLGGAALLAGWAEPARAAQQRRRDVRALMGTQVRIAALGEPDIVAPAIDAAWCEMARLAALFSHYSATSQVAAINLAAGLQPVPVAAELLDVLAMAGEVSRRSEGAFDLTVGSLGRWHFDPAAPAMPAPDEIRAGLANIDWRELWLDRSAGTAMLARRGMRIDSGGIAKLPILQAGLHTLRSHGVATALIDGGGDVVAATAPCAQPWRVGIRDPRMPSRLAGALQITHGFVASSGDYERCFVRDGRKYHHVLDPRTGYPTTGPHGVTLVADSLEAVNGIGTALMVLAPGAGAALLRASGVDNALVGGRNGRLQVTPALQRRLIAA
nr:FAD:protein FMN transferase [Aquabacterium terrae]